MLRRDLTRNASAWLGKAAQLSLGSPRQASRAITVSAVRCSCENLRSNLPLLSLAHRWWAGS
jgi:hypothetical protein